jgi:SAM-dependent methyltransferase
LLPQPEPPTSFQHGWVNEKSLLRKTLRTNPSIILDCGCGVGRWGYLLKGKHVVGLDRHKPYLLKAKRYEEVICGSASCLPFQPLSFHVGLGIELIEHLPKHEGSLFLHDIRRVCRHIVLTTPKNFEPINFGEDHPETHKSYWSKSELLVALKCAK